MQVNGKPQIIKPKILSRLIRAIASMIIMMDSDGYPGSYKLHGVGGLMKEYAVERHYRNQKLLDIGEGTSEVQRIVIARHIGVPGRAL